MSEVNIRYERDLRFAKRLTAFGVILAAILWPISYECSLSAATAGQGIWFATVSTATLIAAIGTTVGSVIGIGTVMTMEPPLAGSNY